LVWFGDVINPEFVYDSMNVYYLPDNKFLEIELAWNTYNIGNGDAGDFDIHLINLQNGDSCWYGNERPDWGIENEYFDDPDYYDHPNSNNSDHALESMDIDRAAVGTYLLKVFYFSNFSGNSQPIRPEVEIEIGSNTYMLQSPNEMSVGDIWIVAEINVTNGAINKINQHINVPKNYKSVSK